MQIYIKDTFGDTKCLQFSPDTTISFIMEKLSLIPGSGLSLIFWRNPCDAIILNPDKSLNDYHIQDGMILKIARTITVSVQHYKYAPKLLQILMTDTLKNLKIKIANLFQINEHSLYSFRVYLNQNGKELYHENCTMMDYGICDHQCLYLILSEYKGRWRGLNGHIMVIALNGTCIELNNVRPTDTIKDIKIMVQKRMRIYHTRQILIFAGRQLEDHKTLIESGVDDNSTLHLEERLIKDDHDYLYTVNELLCDEDIEFAMDYDQLYQNMMNQWCFSHMYDDDDDTILNIENVFKIQKNYQQNINIYNALLSIKKNKGTEDMLFHGTSFDNITKIINTGFNRDYNITSLYGKGTYFSNEAKLAAGYCIEYEVDNYIYAMLACKVYIGDSTVGKANMDKSELYKDDKVTQYDSLVNDLDDPTIFVINRDYHAVPCFVIVFTVQ